MSIKKIIFSKNVLIRVVVVLGIIYICFSLLKSRTGQNKVDRYDAVLQKLKEAMIVKENTALPPHRFFLDYAVVDHSLKNDNGYSMELLDLYEKDRDSAVFIAEFWHQKAVKECMEAIQQTAHRYSRQITLGMSEEEKAKINSKGEKEARQLFYGYYYDNWDGINKTIEDKLRNAKIRFRKK